MTIRRRAADPQLIVTGGQELSGRDEVEGTDAVGGLGDEPGDRPPLVAVLVDQRRPIRGKNRIGKGSRSRTIAAPGGIVTRTSVPASRRMPDRRSYPVVDGAVALTAALGGAATALAAEATALPCSSAARADSRAISSTSARRCAAAPLVAG